MRYRCNRGSRLTQPSSYRSICHAVSTVLLAGTTSLIIRIGRRCPGDYIDYWQDDDINELTDTNRLWGVAWISL